jgi:crotonobetainyl-CoA:carnitine CoA-transferase CaiB-like acyl-CoA transferase
MSDDADAASHSVLKRGKEIERLSARSESFRDLCADFAMAQDVLSEWKASTAPEREERCAEYRQLISELAEEIDAALDAAAVIPFAKSSKP